MKIVLSHQQLGIVQTSMNHWIMISKHHMAHLCSLENKLNSHSTKNWTYTAVRRVLDPPELAPSMLNMWPPLAWFFITRMASQVQSREPTMFVETIYHETKWYSANQLLLWVQCVYYFDVLVVPYIYWMNLNHKRARLITNLKPKSILAWPSQFYYFLSHQPAKLIEDRITKRLIYNKKLQKDLEFLLTYINWFREN